MDSKYVLGEMQTEAKVRAAFEVSLDRVSVGVKHSGHSSASCAVKAAPLSIATNFTTPCAEHTACIIFVWPIGTPAAAARVRANQTSTMRAPRSEVRSDCSR